MIYIGSCYCYDINRDVVIECSEGDVEIEEWCFGKFRKFK